MRWLCASVLAAIALFAAPSRSLAGTQILIQELDGGGNPVSGQTSTGTSASFATANFLSIQVTTTPNSAAISSLNTSVTSALAASFDPTHSLQVVVTSDGFVNPFPGQPGTIDNNAGASSGIVGGTNIITGQTTLLDAPGGNVLLGPTAIATDTRPSSGTTNDTTANAASLPANFAIQQVIVVRATNSTGIQSGSTVGGTVGSTVLTNAAAVPAPAGLILALAAIPALGLRRALRRSA